MDNELNPLQMVAREMSDHSDLEQETIEDALKGLLGHLQSRAMAEIEDDPNSNAARQAAVQYRVICETVAMFGTQLIAYEDIDEEIMEGESN